MAALRQNLRIDQGATLVFAVDVTNAGVPANITGFTAKMQIRPEPGSPTLYDELTSPSAGITVNPGTSQVVVEIDEADTADYDWDEGYYDLLLTGGGRVYRLMEGRVYVSRSVTV